MSVFRSIVFAAVVSGLVTGTAVTVVQQFGTVPLILKAETFEHDTAERCPAGRRFCRHCRPFGSRPWRSHQHDGAAWKPVKACNAIP